MSLLRAFWESVLPAHRQVPRPGPFGINDQHCHHFFPKCVRSSEPLSPFTALLCAHFTPHCLCFIPCPHIHQGYPPQSC